MVLLQATKNNRLGNKSFAAKRPALKSTPYYFTKQVGRKTDWEPKDIDERQEKMAEIAVETWPLRPA